MRTDSLYMPEHHEIDRAAGADVLGARQPFFQIAEQVGDGLAKFLLVGDGDAAHGVQREQGQRR